MTLAGRILQIMAWVVFLGSVATALPTVIPPGNFVTGLTLVLSGIVGGALLFGIGGIFLFVEDVAIDTRRSAVALEALIQRRTGVGTSPPDAAKRLRQQPPKVE